MTWHKLWTPRHPQPKPRRPRFRPQIEALEDRQVPALIGTDLAIDFSTKPQDHSAAAGSTNGASVVVWEDHFSASDTDISARLTLADGTTSNLNVAFSTANERDPAVAMDRNGRFVVVWVEDVPGFLSSQGDIKAQRFNADGTKRGGIITVAGTDRDETEPSVAMRDNGDFVVSLTLDLSGLFVANKDIRARMFRFSDGAQTAHIAVVSSASIDRSSSVARADDGRFMVAFQTDGDIKLRRFSATGASLGATITITHTTTTVRHPSVAVDNHFKGVVVWEQVDSTHKIRSRTINASGSLNSNVVMAGSSQNQHSNPVVAMDRDATGFRFVVAFQTHPATSSGTSLDNHISLFEVTSTTLAPALNAGDGVDAAIAVSGRTNGQSNYIVARTALDSLNNPNILGRLGSF